MAGRNPNFNTVITAKNRDQVETASENLRDAAEMLFDAARNLGGADLKRSEQLRKEARRFNALAFWMQAAVNRYDEAPDEIPAQILAASDALIGDLGEHAPQHECTLRADGVSLCCGDRCAIENRECDCGNMDQFAYEAALETAAEKVEVPA